MTQYLRIAHDGEGGREAVIAMAYRGGEVEWAGQADKGRTQAGALTRRCGPAVPFDRSACRTGGLDRRYRGAGWRRVAPARRPAAPAAPSCRPARAGYGEFQHRVPFANMVAS